MPPAAQSLLFTSDEDAEGLLSVLGVQARVDDDAASGGTDSARIAAVKSQGRNYATARVKFFCQPRYRTEDLAGNWLVNDWATVLYAVWLCRHRGEAAPEQLVEMMKQAEADMKDVREGKAHIPDIGTANPDWPAWSNVTVDPRYRVRQIRVQRSISESTPTSYPRATDYAAEAPVE